MTASDHTKPPPGSCLLNSDVHYSSEMATPQTSALGAQPVPQPAPGLHAVQNRSPRAPRCPADPDQGWRKHGVSEVGVYLCSRERGRGSRRKARSRSLKISFAKAAEGSSGARAVLTGLCFTQLVLALLLKGEALLIPASSDAQWESPGSRG